jgi:hypothetical protein
VDKKTPPPAWSVRVPTVISAFLLTVLVVGLGANPAWSAGERSSARVDLIVSGGGVIDPAANNSVSVILRADETGTLGVGETTLNLTETAFTSEDQIRRFISGESAPVTNPISSSNSPEVPQLESREWIIDLPSSLWDERLPLRIDNEVEKREAGIFGLEVSYANPSNLNPSLRSLVGRQLVVVVPQSVELSRANIAPIVTLTTSAAGGIALRPEELQALTIAGGALTLVTQAVERHPASIAIDSRITDSITVLGEQAPSEALTWASTLGDVGLTQFGLPWADADPLGSLAIDTLVYARLGEYPWVHGDSITNEQLATLASRSASAVLVSSTSLPSDRTIVEVGDARIIRVDAQLSALATDALQAPNQLEGEADLQRAQGIIGFRALTNNQEVFVFSVGRLPATAIAPRIDSVLGRLVSMPVSNSVQVPLQAPATEVLSGIQGIAPSREKTAFFADVRALWESDVAFATIAQDAEGAIFGRWTRYQALLSSTWLDNPNGLATEWAQAQLESAEFQNSVRVEQGSAITVLSDTTSLPVTVLNSLNSDAVVTLVVRPTTGILAVETPAIRITVPAEGSIRTLVPVQSLANGTVNVDFLLVSASGEQVGQTVTIPVTIRAGWEGVISIVLAVAVGGTFAFGIVRAIQRRRRELHELEATP